MILMKWIKQTTNFKTTNNLTLVKSANKLPLGIREAYPPVIQISDKSETNVASLCVWGVVEKNATSAI